jgi:RNA polymerase sigma factor (sigma-70 family)
VELLLQKIENTFELIYKIYAKLVYNISLSYTQNVEEAQDLTQEIFIKIYQKQDKFNDDLASLKTWIYQISINHCLDHIRAKKTNKRFAFFIGLFNPINDEPISEATDFSHPGIELEDKEELQILFKHINSLPEKQKTVIILSKIEEHSQKEVAEIMILSIKAVESLLQRAKENLSKKLNP